MPLGLLLEYISEHNLSHTLLLRHIYSHRRTISLASLYSSKINFLHACVLLARGQWMYSSFMTVDLKILTPSKLSRLKWKRYLAALTSANRHFQSWTLKKTAFCFWLNDEHFHTSFILEVSKQMFTSLHGPPDLRNPTRECNDSMNISIHWNIFLQ